MIFVTGDTHGLLDTNKLIKFASAHSFSNDDYVIVAGDFGAVWDVNSIGMFVKFYNDLPFTTLFIDGNHENFDYLYSFPIEDWNGGKIHRISSKILHLIRGETFVINGLKILAIGGAESVDKESRIKYLSWWPQETITMSDIEKALESASKYKQVDCVITHTCPSIFVTDKLLTFQNHKVISTSEERLNIIANKVKFSKWFFGHWHLDMTISANIRAVYQDIIKLD